MIRPAAVAAAIVLAGAAPPDTSTPPSRPSQPAPTTAVPTPAPPPAPGTSWFALPIVFWLPETRLGFAAAGGLQFHLRGTQRASSIFLVGAYTLEAQSSIDLATDLQTPGGTVLTGRLRVVNFPDQFFGIGPDTPDSAREDYTRRWNQAIFGAEVPLHGRKLRAGPRLDLRVEDIRNVQPGGQLASGTIEGSNGFSAVGLGGSAAWDTRDLPLYPSHGQLVEAWLLWYPKQLGHHDEFTAMSVEGRTFHAVGGGRIVAAAAYIEDASGQVPFTLLPKLGSTGYLRGWREGRFRDHLATAAQVELRMPIWDRFSGVAFVSAGEVAPDLGGLRWDTLRASAGVGVRFRLTPEGTNIRLDVADSSAGPEVYLLLLEAF
jgi:hypothetical protein